MTRWKLYLHVIFFFSSRRRHTRYWRDWSSDVCSSDLRENDRIQIFSPEGQFLEQWTDVQRPTNIRFDREGCIYVSELWWRIGQRSQVHGQILEDKPGRVSIFDPEGHVLARWGGPDRCAPGNFIAPHDICVDSRG